MAATENRVRRDTCRRKANVDNDTIIHDIEHHKGMSFAQTVGTEALAISARRTPSMHEQAPHAQRMMRLDRNAATID